MNIKVGAPFPKGLTSEGQERGSQQEACDEVLHQRGPPLHTISPNIQYPLLQTGREACVDAEGGEIIRKASQWAVLNQETQNRQGCEERVGVFR